MEEERINKLKDNRLIEIMKSEKRRRKKNEEKWTDPHTNLGHHYTYHICIMRLPEGE